MKGLETIPSTSDLSSAYDALLQPTVTEKQIALWSQWTRFDPRLGEILVRFLSSHWRDFNALELRSELLVHSWAQAFGVIAENLLASRLLKKNEAAVFRNWVALVLTDIPLADGELFYFGLRQLGGKAALQDVEYASKPYTRWGYYARDLMLNKSSSIKNPSTILSPPTRRKILAELMKSSHRFTLRDYRIALENRVSVRQAELDLKNEKGIVASGNTRARFYRVRAGRKKSR